MLYFFNTSRNLLRYNTRALCSTLKNIEVVPNHVSQCPGLSAPDSCSFSALSSQNCVNPLGSARINSNYITALIGCRAFSSGSSIPAGLWKLGRLNHIAIAVPDLDKATSFYRDVLQATVSPPQPLPEHGVTTVFVELDNTKIELLLPLGDKSPIQKFLEKNKSGGLHHVCLEVDDIEAAVTSVRGAGVRCLSPATRIGAHGKPVMFLHPADCGGVLLELEQA